jgi:hypothetical protein
MTMRFNAREMLQMLLSSPSYAAIMLPGSSGL